MARSLPRLRAILFGEMRIGLSAQLARLRDLFGDELLTPAASGKGMVLTPRGAELREPLRLPVASASAPIPAASAVDLNSGTMQARLTAAISSALSKKGDPVSAVLVTPFCNSQGRLMLAAGTSLTGAVLQARPARSFARSGRLRFRCRSPTLC